MKPEILDILNKNNIRIFNNRIITNAQPPITEQTIQEIEKSLSGPIPSGLKELWDITFGGALDYDLRINYDGHIHPFSFAELFYPESGHYKDFWGWFEHEMELAAEAALERNETFSGKLDFLPFGGFEYLERLYVSVCPGKNYGSVIAWSQGLPPAWTMSLNEDSIATIAPDISSLFSNLCYEANPFDNSQVIYTGDQNLEIIEQINNQSEDGRETAQYLEQLMKSAVIDRYKKQDADALEIEDAIESKNWPKLKKLFDSGYAIDTPLKGGGNILDFSMSRGALEIAKQLLKLGVTSDRALINGAAWVTPQMAKEFLSLGNTVTANEVITALHFNENSYEVAYIFSQSILLNQSMTFHEFDEFIKTQINDYELCAKRIDEGDFFSNISAEKNREYANALRQIIASLSKI